MVEAILDNTNVSSEDALKVANEELSEMTRLTRERKQELAQRLKEHVGEALSQTFPKFKNPVYRSLLEKLEELVVDRFASFRRLAFIEQNYARFEKNFLLTFLSSIPHITENPNALARDLLADNLIHSFEKAGLKLSIEEIHYVRNFFDALFTLFCGLAKAGLEDEANEIYDEREKLLLSGLRSSLQQSKNADLVHEFRRQCNSVLIEEELKLTEYQRINVCDQLLWLFRDYVNAPDEEKDQVYATGEERIIISILDPTRLSRPALSTSVD
jgi:hypothetical protein